MTNNTNKKPKLLFLFSPTRYLFLGVDRAAAVRRHLGAVCPPAVRVHRGEGDRRDEGALRRQETAQGPYSAYFS